MVHKIQAATISPPPRTVGTRAGRGADWTAARAGLGRESLCKALSPGDNPDFATVLKVMRAPGLRPHASSAATP